MRPELSQSNYLGRFWIDAHANDCVRQHFNGPKLVRRLPIQWFTRVPGDSAEEFCAGHNAGQTYEFESALFDTPTGTEPKGEIITIKYKTL
jgi:hypothetical protein